MSNHSSTSGDSTFYVLVRLDYETSDPLLCYNEINYAFQLGPKHCFNKNKPCNSLDMWDWRKESIIGIRDDALRRFLRTFHADEKSVIQNPFSYLLSIYWVGILSELYKVISQYRVDELVFHNKNEN